MFKRISCLFFALLLTMPASPLNGPARVNSTLPPGIRVYQDDERGVIFRLETESYSLEEISIEGELYQDVAVPGAGPGGATGNPELQLVSVLIGVLPRAQVELRATARDVIQVGEKVRLPPVPHSLPPHDEYGAARLAYARDDVAYSADLWLPLEAARIAEDAWLRDQHLVRVEVFPFQINAAQEALVWLRSLQVELVFHDGEVVERQAFDRTGNLFEAWLRASLLIYDSARAWRSNPGLTSAASPTPRPQPTATPTRTPTVTPTETPTPTVTTTLIPLPSITLLFPAPLSTATGEPTVTPSPTSPAVEATREAETGLRSGQITVLSGLIVVIWLLLGGFLVVYLRRLGH